MDLGPTQTRIWNAALLVTVSAMLIASYLIQANVLLNHDVGWVLESAGWLLDGARFGHDVVAANPPLIWWLSIPAVWLSRVTPLTDVDAIRVSVWVIAMWSLWATHALLAPLRLAGLRLEAAIVVASLAFAVLVLPGGVFAQREHIAFMLTIPYAVLTAARCRQDNGPGVAILATVGGAAGIAFALKPHFLIVPIGLEFALAMYRGSIRQAIRTETASAALVLLLYPLAIFLLAPDYLDFAIPLFRSVYWAFENTPPYLLLAKVAPAIWISLSALGIAAATRSITPLHAMLAVVALAYLCSYGLQGKGYSYHAFPAIAASTVLIAYASTFAARQAARRLGGTAAIARVLVLLSLFSLWPALLWPQVKDLRVWYAEANTENGPAGRRRVQLIEAVQGLIHAPDDVILAFSTHPYPGFPTMNYVDARWGARTNSQVAIPALIKRRFDPGAGPGIDLTEAERFTRESALHDLVQNRPRVVLVQAGLRKHAIGHLRYDAIEFLSEDPRFAAAWRDYRESGRIGSIRIFARTAEATSRGREHPTPVAASGALR